MREQERKRVQIVQVCWDHVEYTTFVPNSGTIEPSGTPNLGIIQRWVNANLDRAPVLWEVLFGTWREYPEITLVQQEVRHDIERGATNTDKAVQQYLADARLITTGTRAEVLKVFKLYARML